jgi:hypothetical protein
LPHKEHAHDFSNPERFSRTLGQQISENNDGSLMKKTALMMCLIAGFAIFTPPVDAAKVVNQSIPITLSVPVPCVGEVVDLSGKLHTVITFTSNKRRVNAHVHVNTQGITGTGEITGHTYQANGVINLSFHQSLLNGQGTTTFIVRLEVTGASGPGFTLQDTAHVTFNANGTVTVNFDNFKADCT